jgi:FADH2 O2-dependent halogenase
VIETDSDITILGSGFAGSLTAMLVQQIGLRPLVIDRTRHPRFAIGESSTPIANMVLGDLASRYSLPRLAPLCKYGSWQRSFPDLPCGLKRGFSYFHHVAGKPFRARADHANELLVAASTDDLRGDTHWYRADLDQHLVAEARRCKVPVFEGTHIDELREADGSWELSGQCDGESIRVRTRFLIDASGPAAVLPKRVGAQDVSESLRTRSRAIYSHFTGLPSWHDQLQELGARVRDHPFHCDHAAQHHILDAGWVWVLRFSNEVASAGLVLDEHHWPLNTDVPTDDEWRSQLGQYPALERSFQNARLADSPGQLVRTSRLQRLWSIAAGQQWVALPHTVGFIDPLHSSGIAQTLCGIERLIEILEHHWNTDRLVDRLREYEVNLYLEFALIDKLVAGCFQTFKCFSMLAAYTMLYFAAATTYEHRRATGARPAAFLCADDAKLVRLIDTVLKELPTFLKSDPEAFASRVAELIAPYNRVGLFAPDQPNMYHYTARL